MQIYKTNKYRLYMDLNPGDKLDCSKSSKTIKTWTRQCLVQGTTHMARPRSGVRCACKFAELKLILNMIHIFALSPCICRFAEQFPKIDAHYLAICGDFTPTGSDQVVTLVIRCFPVRPYQRGSCETRKN